MRTLHAFIVSVALYMIYLAFVLAADLNNHAVTLNSFLGDHVQSIIWWCALYFLAISFDFARKATHETSYEQINSDFFMWTVTISLLFQLVLAGSGAIMIMDGSLKLIALLHGYETPILLFIIGSALINAIGYAIAVDQSG